MPRDCGNNCSRVCTWRPACTDQLGSMKRAILRRTSLVFLINCSFDLSCCRWWAAAIRPEAMVLRIPMIVFRSCWTCRWWFHQTQMWVQCHLLLEQCLPIGTSLVQVVWIVVQSWWLTLDVVVDSWTYMWYSQCQVDLQFYAAPGRRRL